MIFRFPIPAAVLYFVVLMMVGFVGAEEPPAVSSNLLLKPADAFWDQLAPELFRVCFTTSEGDFVVEVHRAWAPLGVDRFYNLVRAGFFDDSRFFRIRVNYIAQFGIAGNPAISAVWKARSFKDDPVRETNTRGTFAYAMTGPDTRTTQLYINLADNTHLDSQGFAPLGHVIEGMDVVDRLYAGYDENAGGGMRRGKQGRMFNQGNAHLDQDFPKLTRLGRARGLAGSPSRSENSKEVRDLLSEGRSRSPSTSRTSGSKDCASFAICSRDGVSGRAFRIE